MSIQPTFRKIKFLFNVVNGATPQSAVPEYWDGDIPWVTPEDIANEPNPSIYRTKRSITREGYESCGTTLAPKNSIILTTRAPIGNMGISEVKLCSNQGCKILIPTKEVNPKYAYYSVFSRRENLISLGQGSTFRELSSDSLRNVSIPFPPLPVQKAIAAYLDKETARIDALIAKKERQIELLQEKRQAIITRAITKGLDQNALMKDSGVEWIGEIPEGWGKCKVWMLFQLGRGRVISHEDIHNSQGDYPVYSSQTENDGILGSINTYDFYGDYLTWTTDGANAGTVFERHGKFNCTNVCGTLKPIREVNLTYMREAISISTAYFVRHDINPKLMNNVMASIDVIIPPIKEQELIATQIKTLEEDTLLPEKKIRDSINLLKEYRSSLITAAVSGQIDISQEVHK